MDHLLYSIKYSRSAGVSLSRDADGPVDTIVAPSHFNSHDDHAIAVAPVPQSAVDSAATPDDSLSITALVVGLASAAFFLLLVLYVVYKVHWKDRRQVKTTKSKISQQHLEEGGAAAEPKQTVHSSPTSNSNLSDMWVSSQGPWPCKSRTFRQALDSKSMQSIDFNSRPSESALDSVGTIAHARLTAARFLTGE